MTGRVRHQSQAAWVQVLVLLLASCVTVDKLHNCSEPLSPVQDGDGGRGSFPHHCVRVAAVRMSALGADTRTVPGSVPGTA